MLLRLPQYAPQEPLPKPRRTATTADVPATSVPIDVKEIEDAARESEDIVIPTSEEDRGINPILLAAAEINPSLLTVGRSAWNALNTKI